MFKKKEGIEDLAINLDYQYDDEELLGILSARLSQLKLPLIFIPEHAVGTSAISLKQYLKEEQQANRESGARTLLIPYNVGGYHWLGVLISINAQQRISEIKVINSLEGKHYDEILLKAIREAHEIYPELQTKTIQSLKGWLQADGTSCGPLTVENLLLVAEGKELPSRIIEADALKAIRQAHVACYQKTDSTFSERQRNNSNRVASIQQQHQWLQQAGTRFNVHELERMEETSRLIKNIHSADIQKALVEAFRTKVNEEPKQHLDRIRKVLDSLPNRAFEDDKVTIQQLLRVLLDVEISTAISFSLDNFNFKLPYQAIVEIGVYLASTSSIVEKISGLDQSSQNTTAPFNNIAREAVSSQEALIDFNQVITGLMNKAKEYKASPDPDVLVLIEVYGFALALSRQINNEAIKKKLEGKIVKAIEQFIFKELRGKQDISLANFADNFRGFQLRLENFRAEAKEDLTDSGINSAEQLTAFLAKNQASFEGLINDIFEYLHGIVPNRPKTYAILSIGSLATQMATPYSDIEYVVLVDKFTDKAKTYFTNFGDLFELMMIGFGESPINKARILLQDFELYFKYIKKGARVDEHKKPQDVNRLFGLINTPQAFLQKLPGNIIQQRGNHLTAALLTVGQLDKHTNETLYENYRVLFERRLPTKEYYQCLQKLLEQGSLECKNGIAALKKAFREQSNEQQEVKKLLVHPLHLVRELAVFLRCCGEDITLESNPLAQLQVLQEKELITEIEATTWSQLITRLLRIRLELQMQSESAEAKISLDKFNEKLIALEELQGVKGVCNQLEFIVKLVEGKAKGFRLAKKESLHQNPSFSVVTHPPIDEHTPVSSFITTEIHLGEVFSQSHNNIVALHCLSAAVANNTAQRYDIFFQNLYKENEPFTFILDARTSETLTASYRKLFVKLNYEDYIAESAAYQFYDQQWHYNLLNFIAKKTGKILLVFLNYGHICCIEPFFNKEFIEEFEGLRIILTSSIADLYTMDVMPVEYRIKKDYTNEDEGIIIEKIPIIHCQESDFKAADSKLIFSDLDELKKLIDQQLQTLSNDQKLSVFLMCVLDSNYLKTEIIDTLTRSPLCEYFNNINNNSLITYEQEKEYYYIDRAVKNSIPLIITPEYKSALFTLVSVIYKDIYQYAIESESFLKAASEYFLHIESLLKFIQPYPSEEDLAQKIAFLELTIAVAYLHMGYPLKSINILKISLENYAVDSEIYLQRLIILAKSYNWAEKREHAIKYLKIAEMFVNKHLGKYDIAYQYSILKEYGDAYLFIGGLLGGEINFEKASEYYNQIFKKAGEYSLSTGFSDASIKEEGKVHIINAQLGLAKLYHYQNKYQQADEYLQAAKAELEKNVYSDFEKIELFIVLGLNQRKLADNFSQLSLYSNAQGNLLKAERLLLDKSIINYLELSRVSLYQGVICRKLGNLLEAERYNTISLNIRLEIFGVNNAKTAFSFRYLGLINFAKSRKYQGSERGNTTRKLLNEALKLTETAYNICCNTKGGKSYWAKKCLKSLKIVQSSTNERPIADEKNPEKFRQDLIKKMDNLNEFKNEIKKSSVVAINSRNEFGRTLMHAAASLDKVAAIRVLYEHGGDTLATDKWLFTPFLSAVYCNSLCVIKYLLTLNQVNVNYIRQNGFGALHICAYMGYTEMAALLLGDSRIKPNIRDSKSISAKDYATTFGHSAITRLFEDKIEKIIFKHNPYPINDKADEENFRKLIDFIYTNNRTDFSELIESKPKLLTLQDQHGWSLLHHIFSEEGRSAWEEMVINFSKKHEDLKIINIKTKNQETIVIFAAQNGYRFFLKYIIKSNYKDLIFPEENRKNENYQKNTALYMAVQHGQLESVKLLTRLFMEKETNDDSLVHHWTWSPFYLAIVLGRLNILKYFLELEYGISKYDKKWPPLHEAVCCFHPNKIAIIKLLLEKDKEKTMLDCLDEFGDSALKLATRRQDEETIDLLIAYNVKTDLVDSDGLTPLYFAVLSGVTNIIQNLSKKNDQVKSNTLKPARSSIMYEQHSVADFDISLENDASFIWPKVSIEENRPETMTKETLLKSINLSKVMVISGESGIGKTTFLKQASLSLLNKDFLDTTFYLPLYMRCKSDDNKNIKIYFDLKINGEQVKTAKLRKKIDEIQSIINEMEDILKEYKITLSESLSLVLFIDSASLVLRDELLSEIMACNYIKAIFACNDGFYLNKEKLKVKFGIEINFISILGFDENMIEDYLIHSGKNHLLHHLKERDSRLNLFKIPMFLSLLIEAEDEFLKMKSIPVVKSYIYKVVLETLLTNLYKNDENEKETKYKELKALAFIALCDLKSRATSYSKITKNMNSDSLDIIRKHQSWNQYLAACYIIERGKGFEEIESEVFYNEPELGTFVSEILNDINCIPFLDNGDEVTNYVNIIIDKLHNNVVTSRTTQKKELSAFSFSVLARVHTYVFSNKTYRNILVGKSNLNEAIFNRTIFIDSSFENADMSRALLNHVKFENCNTINLKLNDAMIIDTVINQKDLIFETNELLYDAKLATCLYVIKDILIFYANKSIYSVNISNFPKYKLEKIIADIEEPSLVFVSNNGKYLIFSYNKTETRVIDLYEKEKKYKIKTNDRYFFMDIFHGNLLRITEEGVFDCCEINNIFSIKDFYKLNVLELQAAPVHVVANNDYLAIYMRNKMLIIYEISSDNKEGNENGFFPNGRIKLTQQFSSHSEFSVSALSIKNNSIYYATVNGLIVKIDIKKSGCIKKSFDSPIPIVNSIKSCSNNSELFISGENEYNICLLNLGKKSCQYLSHNISSGIKYQEVFSNDRLICVSENKIALLSAGKQMDFALTKKHQSKILCLKHIKLNNDDIVLSADRDGKILEWSLMEKSFERFIYKYQKAIRCFAYNEKLKIVACGTEDGYALIFNLINWRLQKKIYPCQSSNMAAITQMVFSPNDDYLFCIDIKGNLLITADLISDMLFNMRDTRLMQLYSTSGFNTRHMTNYGLLVSDTNLYWTEGNSIFTINLSEYKIQEKIKNIIQDKNQDDIDVNIIFSRQESLDGAGLIQCLKKLDNFIVFSEKNTGLHYINLKLNGKRNLLLNAKNIVKFDLISNDKIIAAIIPSGPSVEIYLMTIEGNKIKLKNNFITLRGHQGEVTDVVHDTESGILITAGNDQNILQWNFDHKKVSWYCAWRSNKYFFQHNSLAVDSLNFSSGIRFIPNENESLEKPLNFTSGYGFVTLYNDGAEFNIADYFTSKNNIKLQAEYRDSPSSFLQKYRGYATSDAAAYALIGRIAEHYQLPTRADISVHSVLKKRQAYLVCIGNDISTSILLLNAGAASDLILYAVDFYDVIKNRLFEKPFVAKINPTYPNLSLSKLPIKEMIPENYNFKEILFSSFSTSRIVIEFFILFKCIMLPVTFLENFKSVILKNRFDFFHDLIIKNDGFLQEMVDANQLLPVTVNKIAYYALHPSLKINLEKNDRVLLTKHFKLNEILKLLASFLETLPNSQLNSRPHFELVDEIITAMILIYPSDQVNNVMFSLSSNSDDDKSLLYLILDYLQHAGQNKKIIDYIAYFFFENNVSSFYRGPDLSKKYPHAECITTDKDNFFLENIEYAIKKNMPFSEFVNFLYDKLSADDEVKRFSEVLSKLSFNYFITLCKSCINLSLFPLSVKVLIIFYIKNKSVLIKNNQQLCMFYFLLSTSVRKNAHAQWVIDHLLTDYESLLFKNENDGVELLLPSEPISLDNKTINTTSNSLKKLDNKSSLIRDNSFTSFSSNQTRENFKLIYLSILMDDAMAVSFFYESNLSEAKKYLIKCMNIIKSYNNLFKISFPEDYCYILSHVANIYLVSDFYIKNKLDSQFMLANESENTDQVTLEDLSSSDAILSEIEKTLIENAFLGNYKYISCLNSVAYFYYLNDFHDEALDRYKLVIDLAKKYHTGKNIYFEAIVHVFLCKIELEINNLSLNIKSNIEVNKIIKSLFIAFLKEVNSILSSGDNMDLTAIKQRLEKSYSVLELFIYILNFFQDEIDYKEFCKENHPYVVILKYKIGKLKLKVSSIHSNAYIPTKSDFHFITIGSTENNIKIPEHSLKFISPQKWLLIGFPPQKAEEEKVVFGLINQQDIPFYICDMPWDVLLPHPIKDVINALKMHVNNNFFRTVIAKDIQVLNRRFSTVSKTMSTNSDTSILPNSKSSTSFSDLLNIPSSGMESEESYLRFLDSCDEEKRFLGPNTILLVAYLYHFYLFLWKNNTINEHTQLIAYSMLGGINFEKIKDMHHILVNDNYEFKLMLPMKSYTSLLAPPNTQTNGKNASSLTYLFDSTASSSTSVPVVHGYRSNETTQPSLVYTAVQENSENLLKKTSIKHGKNVNSQ